LLDPDPDQTNKDPKLSFLGLAKQLMDGLEVLSDKKNCYFVDLFVRVSNKATHQSSIKYLFNNTAKF
jgi:hypothetical protein